MIQNIFLNLITNLINVFLDFLYPENISCILCDCSISKNTTYSMCKDCFSNINFILDGCIKCGKPIINYSLEEQSIDGCSYCLNKSFYFDKVISCVEYTEISKKIVFGLKYNNKTYLSKYIATIMKEKLDLENIKFDYILFGDVLEHLHNPSKVIHNCHHILKKKGKIISSIPNLMHFTVLHELINGNFHYADTGLLDKTHIHFFTYNEIVKMYEENDFNVISTVASNVTPMLSKKDSDFIDALTKLSSHKNDMLFKAFQYITLAEIKDT